MDAAKLKKMGRKALEIERAGLDQLLARIDDDFARACQILLACQGRIVVTGMGKSGHIGGKIAATLASTGAPAFFVHPGEASHGDLGMITRQDVVLALSYSGETPEILAIVPLIKRLGVPLVSMTGKPGSTLARGANVHIDVSVAQEACPLNLAPTASTTATLAMGDALAVAMLEARGFTEADFAMTHPGGALGKRLLLKIHDIMHTGARVPKVTAEVPLTKALEEMSGKGFGLTAVVDGAGKVVGVYTDGDLRRTLDHGMVDVRKVTVGDVMTRGGKHARSDQLAAEAVNLMEKHKITALLVTDEANSLVGVLHMHDLLRAGVY
ncbi:MAG TPA: KpsF/GutQ family sugar-phosphate isomerase [Verrucomicrobiae bacterium]|nr:KpsF/GutQ family sugar-phosphate isomerase [Verrucomicrobiae bacterium]